MSVIEDVRKLLQDLVTPEFQALKIEVKHLSEKIDGVERSVAELRGEMRAYNDATRREIQAGIAQIVEQLRLDKRVSVLEENLPRKEQ